MPDYLGADQRKTKEEEKEDKPIRGEGRWRGHSPSSARGGSGAAPPAAMSVPGAAGLEERRGEKD